MVWMWVSTMSTSKDLVPEIDLRQSGFDAADVGIPHDGASLTGYLSRLANQFFQSDFQSQLKPQTIDSTEVLALRPEDVTIPSPSNPEVDAAINRLSRDADVSLPNTPSPVSIGFEFLADVRSVADHADKLLDLDAIQQQGLAKYAQIADEVLSDVPNSLANPYGHAEFDRLKGFSKNEPEYLQPKGVITSKHIPLGTLDNAAVRRDFPILNEIIRGRKLVWLDNAATTQKPNAVIDRLSYFYRHENSNIHRAAHDLAARSTDAYEGAREKVRGFLGANTNDEIIFVRGATEGINLVAQSWGRQNIGQGDEIIVTHLEHHANIVPWQMLCSEKGAKLRVVPVDDSGQVILEEYERLLSGRTKLVALAHVSNALGTIVPVEEMTRIAHRVGAKVLIDGAQSVSHMAVDVKQIDCDFFVLSGHKVFAPTGIGVVFGKYEILKNTQPWHGGGNMISDVTFERTQYHNPPMRFEAGTGNIADAIGLGAAIDYVQRLGMGNIARYEHDLLVYATDHLMKIPGLRLIGTARDKASVISFVIDGITTESIGKSLASEGIAVRSGHHCAQPILRRFGVESSVRPSLAFYNNCEEIDRLVQAVWNIRRGKVVSVV